MYQKAWEGHLRQYTLPGPSTSRSPSTACTTKNSRSCSTGCTTPRGSPSSTCRVSPTRTTWVRAPRPALRRLLPGRGPRSAQLRPRAQDHPQPVQRQPRPAAPQGDGPGLGRRPDRGRRAITAGLRSRSSSVAISGKTSWLMTSTGAPTRLPTRTPRSPMIGGSVMHSTRSGEGPLSACLSADPRYET